tara:strand:+ start:72 stop:908 length:837 start_codon:yes stop_codon:yes gene_type:complete
MTQLDGSEVLKAVVEKPLFLEGGFEIPNKKAIMTADTNEYVATVGKKYQIAQTKDTIVRFADSLDEAGLDTNGMIVQASTSRNGVRSAIKFQLPEHTISLRENDNTDLQIVARNSHDGSWPFKIDVGGFRIACANGQVIGEYVDAFRSRHTSNMSYDGVVPGLERSIEMFEQAGHKWVEYRKQRVTREQGEDVILDYLGKSFNDNEERAKLFERKSARRDQMFDDLGAYGKDMGWNLLAVYNTMTDDASHNSDDALVQFERGKKLSNVIDSAHLKLAA